MGLKSRFIFSNLSRVKSPLMQNTKKVGIYARVSTDKQSVDLQMKDLREYVEKRDWMLVNEYVDHGISGKETTKRPEFNRLMADAKKRKLDVVLVWKFDRFSRSLKDLITSLHDLQELGIDFISYQNQVDTTTSQGKLMFSLLAAVAEFERELIVERVKAGLAHAKSKGIKLGRPALTPQMLKKAQDLRTEGLSYRKIAEKLGMDHSTLVKKLKKD